LPDRSNRTSDSACVIPEPHDDVAPTVAQIFDLGHELVEALRPAGEELTKAVAAVVDGLLNPFRDG
jgi:hypothetical protein